MRVFARLLRHARPSLRPLLLAFFLSLVVAATELARPWPTKVVVDNVLTGDPPPWLLDLVGALPGPATEHAILVWAVVASLALVAGGALLSLVVMRMVIRVAQGLVTALARETYDKLQRLSLSFHHRSEMGDLMQRATADVFVAHSAVSQVLLPGTVALLTLAAMFLVMVQIDLVMTLVALAVVPLILLALLGLAPPLERTTRRQYDEQASLMAFVDNGLSGIKAVQAFAREPYMQQHVDRRAGDLGRAYNVATMVGAAYEQSVAVITGFGSAVLLGVGGARVLSGHLSLGDLLIFLAYLGSLYAPVTALSTAVASAVQAVGRGRRVFEVLDATEEITDREDALDLGRARGEIRFENVSFGYEEGRPVLQDLSFALGAGQVAGLVGPSGVGKSSLAALLSRFYDPWAGRVLLDGHDLRELSLRSLRENVAVVLQEPFLFPMSIADNIAFGRPQARAEEIEAAARAAQAHDFIASLPDGYATVVGEHAVRLSGGERQRISIARAILKDAPVLVLDEPTSALDASTEASVLAALASLKHGRTAIVISHRPSALKGADVVLTLDDGRVWKSSVR